MPLTIPIVAYEEKRNESKNNWNRKPAHHME
jgi:hypothetical protein